MKLKSASLLLALGMAAPVFAQDGDAAAGEKVFNRCKACHMIETPAGDMIVRGGRTGPNLYGVVGEPAGAVDGFRYGTGLEKAAEMGLEWTPENFSAYVQDPQGFLREFTGDSAARSKMTFRLNAGAEDLYAYLASLAPES